MQLLKKRNDQPVVLGSFSLIDRVLAGGRTTVGMVGDGPASVGRGLETVAYTAGKVVVCVWCPDSDDV